MPPWICCLASMAVRLTACSTGIGSAAKTFLRDNHTNRCHYNKLQVYREPVPDKRMDSDVMTSGDDDDLIACLWRGPAPPAKRAEWFLLVSRVPSKSAITRVVMCYFRLMLKSDRHDGTPPWRQDQFSTSAVNVCMPFAPSGGNSADDASIMGGCLIIFRVLLS